MPPLKETKNFHLTLGRPSVPRISDDNLQKIDDALAQAHAYPYVPNQRKTWGVSASGHVITQDHTNVGIVSLEVGPGLVIRDLAGDGQFRIELDPELLAVLPTGGYVQADGELCSLEKPCQKCQDRREDEPAGLPFAKRTPTEDTCPI